MALVGVTRVLVVNTGSTTLKLTVLDGDHVERSAQIDAWHGSPDPLSEFAGELDGVDAVGHRVVHGGDRAHPTLVTPDLTAELDQLTELAPLHQPQAVAAINVALDVVREVPHYACFDTSFHSTLPAAARTYPLPPAWRSRWPLRRVGYHGLSHAWVARRAPSVAGLEGAPCRIVSCHLGAGASACAIADGLSVDTTMGFTPLDGLVMATRSGSIDPGLVLWLLRDGRLDVGAVEKGLQQDSGLAGLSGTDGDMRSVLRLRREGVEAAELALAVYVHRLRQAIAAMTASLGGIDILAFTGGVGEHSPVVRDVTASGLEFLGVQLDPDGNPRVESGEDADVTADHATTRTVVISAREDLEIAHQVRMMLAPDEP